MKYFIPCSQAPSYLWWNPSWALTALLCRVLSINLSCPRLKGRVHYGQPLWGMTNSDRTPGHSSAERFTALKKPPQLEHQRRRIWWGYRRRCYGAWEGELGKRRMMRVRFSPLVCFCSPILRQGALWGCGLHRICWGVALKCVRSLANTNTFSNEVASFWLNLKIGKKPQIFNNLAFKWQEWLWGAVCTDDMQPAYSRCSLAQVPAWLRQG